MTKTKPKIIFFEIGIGGGSVNRLLQLLSRWDFNKIPCGIFTFYNKKIAKKLLMLQGLSYKWSFSLNENKLPDPICKIMGVNIPTLHGLRYFIVACVLLVRNPKTIVYLNNTLYSHIPVIFAAFILKKKIICHLRDTISFTFLEKKIVPMIDTFVVLSKSHKDYYSSQGIERMRISVVYDSINLSKFEAPMRSSGNDKRKKKAVVVGTLSDRKGQDICIRALHILAKHGVNTQLLFIGDGEFGHELKKMVLDYNLEDNVSFVGYSNNIPALLNDCDIGILSSRREGFPNSVMEFMAVGLPVIVSELPGIRELVVNGISGFIIPQESHEELSKRWLELLDNDEMRFSMGNEGLKVVRDSRFSPEVEMKEILNIITKLS